MLLRFSKLPCDLPPKSYPNRFLQFPLFFWYVLKMLIFEAKPLSWFPNTFCSLRHFTTEMASPQALDHRDNSELWESSIHGWLSSSEDWHPAHILVLCVKYNAGPHSPFSAFISTSPSRFGGAVSLTTWFLCLSTVSLCFHLSLSLSAQVMDQNLNPTSIPTGLAPEDSENFSSGGIPKTVYMMANEIIC